MLRERVERLLTVGGQLDVVALEPESPLERPPHGGFIVHNEYARHREMMAVARKSW